MYRLLALPALLILSLSGCSTPPAEPVHIRLPAIMTAPCEPLPPLDVKLGEDLRPAILSNRADSERVHAECMARHRAVVNAVNHSTRPNRTERSPR
jgi:hypothetical protein